jgi:hypothetical protein
MANSEIAIDRVKRFNDLTTIEKGRKKNVGVRFSVEELLQLLTKLTGKRALLVDEPGPVGQMPSLDNAELALVPAGQTECGPYRIQIAKASAPEPGIDNNDHNPRSQFNSTKYPKATGAVIMIGRGKSATSIGLEIFPVVGEDIRRGGQQLPKWNFIKSADGRVFAFTDGGGGTGSKTPPPGA